MKSLLTGSHAYGTPGPRSDIDIVMLASPYVIHTLSLLGLPADSGDEVSSASVKFGKLNLILLSDKQKFRAWRRATNRLVKRKPVTRREAVDEIRGELDRLRLLNREALDAEEPVKR